MQIKRFEQEALYSIQDSNNIKANYPTHAHHPEENAKLLFREFDQIYAEYAAFVGFRRSKFDGEFVSTNGVANARKSTNQALDGSYWFLGSSLSWGPGLADWETIPSQFSDMSGQQVFNLGEIGYNSLQNLIHLQLMLARGFRPKHVFVLNSGVDLFNYCGVEQKVEPRHSASQKYYEIFENFRQTKIEKFVEDPVAKNPLGPIRELLVHFLTRPVLYFSGNYKIILMERLDVLQIFKTDFTFSEKIVELMDDKRPSKCGSPSIEQSADQIVNSWLSMKKISELHGFSISFHLTPTAHYKPQHLNLSYFHDFNKRYIAEYAFDVTELYKQIRLNVATICSQTNSCENFVDLTEIFVGDQGYNYMDSDHVSRDGAKILARRLYDHVRGSNQNL